MSRLRIRLIIQLRRSLEIVSVIQQRLSCCKHPWHSACGRFYICPRATSNPKKLRAARRSAPAVRARSSRAVCPGSAGFQPAMGGAASLARAVPHGSAGFQPAKMLAHRAATHWRPRASGPFSENFVRFASFVAKNCRDAIGSNCFLDVSIIQDILKRLDEIPALLVFRNQIPDSFPKSHCFPIDEKNWLHAT